MLLRNDGVLPLAAAQVAIVGEFAKQPRYQGAGSSGITPHRLDDEWTDLVEISAPNGSLRPGLPAVRRTDRRGAARRGASCRAGRRRHGGVRGVATVTRRGCRPCGPEAAGGPRRADRRGRRGVQRVVVVLAPGRRVDDAVARRRGRDRRCYIGLAGRGQRDRPDSHRDAERAGGSRRRFPLHTSDKPVHVWPAGPSVVEYRESIYVGYRYYDTRTRRPVPVRDGLSYTTFAWTELEVADVFDSTSEDTEQRLDVSVRVTNTGDRPGSEVVQVYVRDVESTVFRPDQETGSLREGFLAPGESRRVTLQVDRRAFSFWDTTIDDGRSNRETSRSGRSIVTRHPAVATVTLTSDGPVSTPGHSPTTVHRSSNAPPSRSVRKTTARQRCRRTTPLQRRHPSRGHPAPGRRAADTSVRRKVAATAPALDEDDPLSRLIERSLQELPPRMLPMLTQGGVTPAAAQAFVDICNGHTSAAGGPWWRRCDGSECAAQPSASTKVLLGWANASTR